MTQPIAADHARLLDQSRLEALAAHLVEAARKAGADEADAVAVRSVSLSVEMREGKVEETERAEGDDIGLRVFVGRRSAIVSTNDTLRLDIAGFVARAVAMAKVAPDDPYAGLADAGGYTTQQPDLDLVDPVLADAAELEALAGTAEAAALGVPGVTKSGGASASSALSGFVLATSRGFAGSFLASSRTVSATAIAGEGTGMERDYDYAMARHRADLTHPLTIGQEAGRRAARRVNPIKIPTGRMPVIFEARAAASLIGHLSGALNGAAWARKTSFLAGKLGTQLFKPGIMVVDDPVRPRGLRSRPFDGEGLPSTPAMVIDDGVIALVFTDLASARETGLPATGHGSRGTTSAPGPSATNLHLAAGRTPLGDMIGAIKYGLYVTDLIGSGANPVTGDYSRGASGFLIENGQLGPAVSEVTIAGNLIEMYGALEPADDLVFRYATNSPSVMIDGLTVAGA